MRTFLQVLGALVVSQILMLAPGSAATTPPPFEVVKDHSDIQLQSDGSSIETHEIVYRLLTDAAIQSLRQIRLSYTEGYQDLDVMAAYTLKPNGTRYDVPQDQMLRGFGAQTSPGFQDLKTIEIIFPNLEVGDEVALTTVFRQIKPWFPGQFAAAYAYYPFIVTRDAQVAITAPNSLVLHVDNVGLVGGVPETTAGQTRRTWTYKNESAAPIEENVVGPIDTGPRLLLSTFGSDADVASLYRRMAHGKADVTSSVKAQADQIINGITDRREQARIIYEWVADHIGYVDIVLGAGGFVPHSADEILKTHYGDCKDHVVLLTALLAAEGIVSQPILIDVSNRFKEPTVASPYLFNHMINYLPEFQLFVDSTARFVPFGELPIADADKPVLNIDTGAAMRTPTIPASASSVRTVIAATISRDGSADGDTQISATGPLAIGYRALFQLVNSSNEATFFQKFLGPGGTGTLDKGNIAGRGLYKFGAHFHQENAVSMPGPAGMYPEVGFRMTNFTQMVGGDLPPAKAAPYVCGSLLMTEDVTLKFPAGIKFTSIPDSKNILAEEVSFSEDVERVDQNTLRAVTSLRFDHPTMTCTSDYYARVRPKLAQIITVLRQQIVFRLRDEKAQ